MSSSALSPSTLIRASGAAAMAGGLLFAIFPLVHPEHDAAGYTSWIWVPAHLAPNVGALLALFGLVGLLARQLDRAGWPGVVGFVLAFVGTAAFITGTMIEAFIIPFMELQSPGTVEGPPPPGIAEAFLTVAAIWGIGYVSLGIVTARAGVLPRSVGVLLAIAGLEFAVGDRLLVGLFGVESLWVLGPVMMGAALGWLGSALWSGTGDRAARRETGARLAARAARSATGRT